MARSIFLLTNALLAVLSPLAQAKNKNELRTYVFTSDDCNGPPIGGNEDIKLNNCHNIVSGANSLRTFHNKHEDWIGAINNGLQRCFINTYQYLGCQGNPTAIEELPQAISECISPDHEEPMLSILFRCSPVGSAIQSQNPQVITETRPVIISTWAHTSNSLTTIVSSVLGTFTNTLLPTVTIMPTSTVTVVAPPLVPVQTVTVQYPPVSTNAVTVYVEDYDQSRMRRSDPGQGSVDKDTQGLEPRRKSKWKGPRIGVWMLHPWTMGVICYECYAKSPENTFKFECRSGPKNPVHCEGPVPNPQDTVIVTHTPAVTVTVGEPITTMSVVTVTATQPQPVSPAASPVLSSQAVYTMVGGKPVYTIIDQSMQTITLGQRAGDLEPRKSFHRAVRFTHPWFPGTEMCADAEWDGRGKDRGEIRIQKPDTKMKRCDKDYQVQRIDASPRISTYELPTHTIVISTSTVYSAPVVTVVPSPSVVTVTTTIDPAPAPPVVTVTTIVDPVPAPPVVTVTTIVDPVPAPPVVTVTTIVDPVPAPPVVTVTTIVDPVPAPPVVTVPTIIDPAPAPPVVTFTTIIDPVPAPPAVTVVDPAPAPPMVTLTTIINPAPAYPTLTTITIGAESLDPMVTVTATIDPAPAYSTITTITMEVEPTYSTVTLVPGVAPIGYTTIFQNRPQFRDL